MLTGISHRDDGGVRKSEREKEKKREEGPSEISSEFGLGKHGE